MKGNTGNCLLEFDMIFSFQVETPTSLIEDNDKALDQAIETTFRSSIGIGCFTIFDNEEYCHPNINSDALQKSADFATSLVYKSQFIELLILLDQVLTSILFNFPIIKLSILKLLAFKLSSISKSYEADMAMSIHNAMLLDHKIFNPKRAKYLKTLLENPGIILASRYYNQVILKEYQLSLANVISYSFYSLGYSSQLLSNYSNEELKVEVNSLKSIEIDLMYLLAKFKENESNIASFDDFIENNYGLHKSKANINKAEIISSTIDLYYDNLKSIPINLELDLFGMKNENAQQILEVVSSENKISYNNHNKANATLFSVIKKPEYSKYSLSQLQTSTETIVIDSLQRTKIRKIKFKSVRMTHHNVATEPVQVRKLDWTDKVQFNNQQLFSFGRIKREELNKRTLRKFRKYLGLLIKHQPKTTVSPKTNLFIGNSLFPPLKYMGRTFKSFSSKYMSWIFSEGEVISLYHDFIDMNIDDLVAYFESTYQIESPHLKGNLREYLINLPLIYLENQLQAQDGIVKNSSIYSKNENSECYEISSSNDKIDTFSSGISEAKNTKMRKL